MRRRAGHALAVVAVLGALAIGAAACGDDEGDTDTGPEETATAEFCSSLGDFESTLEAALETSPDATAADVQGVNQGLEGSLDSLSLAAQEADVDIDPIQDALEAAGPAIVNAEEQQTPESVEALRTDLERVLPPTQAIAEANCPGESSTTG